MTVATSILPALLDAIQDGLTSVGGLAGVTVVSGPADAEDLGKEYVAVGLNDPSITLPQAPGAQDLRYRKEAISIPCELRANGPGKGEPNIRAARDRAFTLFAVVEAWVRANKTAGIPAVDALSIRNVQCNQGADDAGRHCVIRFDLDTNTSLIDTE
jgi:hypothetical protein